MSDQANRYANAANMQALGQQGQQQNNIWNATRLSKVWVAYRNYGLEGKSAPIAVFPTKALADVFMAGAESALTSSVEVVELGVTWAS